MPAFHDHATTFREEVRLDDHLPSRSGVPTRGIVPFPRRPRAVVRKVLDSDWIQQQLAPVHARDDPHQIVLLLHPPQGVRSSEVRRPRSFEEIHRISERDVVAVKDVVFVRAAAATAMNVELVVVGREPQFEHPPGRRLVVGADRGERGRRRRRVLPGRAREGGRGRIVNRPTFIFILLVGSVNAPRRHFQPPNFRLVPSKVAAWSHQLPANDVLLSERG
mmetsp:Transcript_37418/g.79854  ORF Transcript_37418/g.79854 Transcript_37418/m.79854 type:complete len:220 (+) Transcript_37418:233-892(+)